MSRFEDVFSEEGPATARGRWGARFGAAAVAFSMGLAVPSAAAGLVGAKWDVRPSDEPAAALVWVPAGIIDGANWVGREADSGVYDTLSWPTRQLEQAVLPDPFGGQSPDQIDQLVPRADS